jgi:hypothetical protein
VTLEKKWEQFVYYNLQKTSYTVVRITVVKLVKLPQKATFSLIFEN